VVSANRESSKVRFIEAIKLYFYFVSIILVPSFTSMFQHCIMADELFLSLLRHKPGLYQYIFRALI